MKEVMHLVSAETYDVEVGGPMEGFCGTSTNDYYYIGASKHQSPWNLAKIKTSVRSHHYGLCPLCEKSELVTLIELGMAEL
jgi:hypothetical protein